MEQARIEHAPNGSLLTYITSADALVNNVYVNILKHVCFKTVSTLYIVIRALRIHNTSHEVVMSHMPIAFDSNSKTRGSVCDSITLCFL